MHLNSQWTQQNAYGGNCTKNSWRPYLHGKGVIRYIITIWCTHLFLSLKQEDTRSKGSSGQRMGKFWENSSVELWPKVKSNKSEVIDEAKKVVKNGAFCITVMDICHLTNAELETKAPEVQGSSCAPRRHCERRFGLLCSIHRARIVCVKHDCRKE